jgi:hypothetical protein
MALAYACWLGVCRPARSGGRGARTLHWKGAGELLRHHRSHMFRGQDTFVLLFGQAKRGMEQKVIVDDPEAVRWLGRYLAVATGGSNGWCPRQPMARLADGYARRRWRWFPILSRMSRRMGSDEEPGPLYTALEWVSKTARNAVVGLRREVVANICDWAWRR